MEVPSLISGEAILGSPEISHGDGHPNVNAHAKFMSVETTAPKLLAICQNRLTPFLIKGTVFSHFANRQYMYIAIIYLSNANFKKNTEILCIREIHSNRPGTVTPLTLSVEMKVDLDVTFDPAKRQFPSANRSRKNRVELLTFGPKISRFIFQGYSQGHVRMVWVAKSTSVRSFVRIDRQR